MDPASVVALASSCGSLIKTCISVVKTLDDMADKFKHAELTWISLSEECSTIQLAWSRIQSWATENLSQIDSSGELGARLKKSIKTGELVIAALEQDLIASKQGVSGKGILRRRRFVWDDNKFRDHQQRLRGQVGTLTLLLEAMQLYLHPLTPNSNMLTFIRPSGCNRSEFLSSKELVFTEADLSILSIVPSQASITSSRKSIDSHASAELRYSPLAFENALFSSYVYKRNFRVPLTRKSKSDPGTSEQAVAVPERIVGQRLETRNQQNETNEPPSRNMEDTIESLATVTSVPQDEESDANQHPSVTSITPSPEPSALDEGVDVVDPVGPQPSTMSTVRGHPRGKGVPFHYPYVYFCTFCAEQGELKLFTGIEWELHETFNHETGEQFRCPIADCSEIYHRIWGLKDHVPSAHPGEALPPDPFSLLGLIWKKHAFGCGFCRQPIDCDEPSKDLWQKRCEHVTHCLQRLDRLSYWTFTNTIIALLRQPALRRNWKYVRSRQCQIYGIQKHQLEWHPSTSHLLRQNLESLEFGPSIERFLTTAFHLGLQDASGNLRSIGILGGMTMSARIKAVEEREYSVNETPPLSLPH